ncbi:MAG: 2'-5' RNA ligase family protein [Actinobacteria bacterium]|nr:2'-5' RNA ligase family protein [Actinomycetota bacterium]
MGTALAVRGDLEGTQAVIRRTGLLVPVEAVEALVGAIRGRWDPVAHRGVPAHVTVLYPFVPADGLSAVEVEAVRDALAPIPAFTFEFLRTGRFGDTVLYLAPEPDAPFRALTTALVARFPEQLPYEGEFDDVVPHLTVADALAAPLGELEATVRAGLPIAARATEVWLMVEGDDNRWTTHTTFPLHLWPHGALAS